MTMLDQLASLARTALDDPLALPELEAEPGEFNRPSYPMYRRISERGRAYAIDRLDEIINTLNPAYNDRETFAATLTILGQHLEERRGMIEELTPDTVEPDTAAYRIADYSLTFALDHIDTAIAALNPECGDDG
jgi:hypothetical protein